MNHFTTNENYEFTNDEIDNKLSTLKSIQILKNKYKGFKFEKCFAIKQKNNGEDWDLGIIKKFEENNKLKIRLFLIQISINKTIQKLQNILRFLDRKIKFIVKKIKYILGINVDCINILFIFNYQTINSQTTSFCNKYNIPYFYFNIPSKKLTTSENKEINIKEILASTSFNKNEKIWKLSLNHEINMIENDDF